MKVDRQSARNPKRALQNLTKKNEMLFYCIHSDYLFPKANPFIIKR